MAIYCAAFACLETCILSDLGASELLGFTPRELMILRCCWRCWARAALSSYPPERSYFARLARCWRVPVLAYTHAHTRKVVFASPSPIIYNFLIVYNQDFAIGLLKFKMVNPIWWWKVQKSLDLAQNLYTEIFEGADHDLAISNFFTEKRPCWFMELSKCNLDITIRKSTLVTSEMHVFRVNIIFFSCCKHILEIRSYWWYSRKWQEKVIQKAHQVI